MHAICYTLQDDCPSPSRSAWLLLAFRARMHMCMPSAQATTRCWANPCQTIDELPQQSAASVDVISRSCSGLTAPHTVTASSHDAGPRTRSPAASLYGEAKRARQDLKKTKSEKGKQTTGPGCQLQGQQPTSHIVSISLCFSCSVTVRFSLGSICSTRLVKAWLDSLVIACS